MTLKSLFPSTWTDRHDQDTFHSLQSAIDRVFEDFTSNSPRFSQGRLFEADNIGNRFPKTDISESEDNVEIEVELPGIEQKDVDVTLNGQYLVIKGERDEEKNTEKKNYRMVERSRGNFQRAIPLGFEAESDAVEANFSKGVLTISVAKPEEVVDKVKKIKIKEPEAA